jgi:hypothetical protein
MEFLSIFGFLELYKLREICYKMHKMPGDPGRAS